MASSPQGALLSAENLAAVLLQPQQQVHARMTNLQTAIVQLM